MSNKVSTEETDQRVLDLRLNPSLFEKGVPAVTGILGKAVPLDNPVYPMPEEIAQVAHLLIELLQVSIGRLTALEQ